MGIHIYFMLFFCRAIIVLDLVTCSMKTGINFGCFFFFVGLLLMYHSGSYRNRVHINYFFFFILRCGLETLPGPNNYQLPDPGSTRQNTRYGTLSIVINLIRLNHDMHRAPPIPSSLLQISIRSERRRYQETSSKKPSRRQI